MPFVISGPLKMWETLRCSVYSHKPPPPQKKNSFKQSRSWEMAFSKLFSKKMAGSFSAIWLVIYARSTSIKHRDSERRYTVSFRQLCGIKPSSYKSVYRQTATTAGLRTVNSSLCPGYWTYYCLITKHTRAHTHSHTHKGYTSCVWALIWAL